MDKKQAPVAKCYTCKKYKSIADDYYADKKSKSGHQGSCKECTLIRARSYYHKNKSQDKKCVHCGVSKNKRAFNINKSAYDGRQSWCKDCQREYNCEWNRKHTKKQRTVSVSKKEKVQNGYIAHKTPQTVLKSKRRHMDIYVNSPIEKKFWVPEWLFKLLTK